MARAFVKLTRPTLRKLEAGQKIMEHGITFERLSSGDGVFSVNVMVDGVRIHRVIGKESDGTTRTQSEEFIEKVTQDAKQGRLNLPKGRKVVLGFSEATDKYIEKLKAEGGKDIKMKKTRFDLHLKPFFGFTPLSKISSFDIERYKKQRQREVAKQGKAGKDIKNGASAELKTTTPGTINRELAALSHLFTKAIEWGWIEKKPTQIKRLKEDQGRITYLTSEQVKRLLDAAKQNENLQIYPFIKIGVMTGMRRTEILSIRREHVALDKLEIYIPKAKAGSRVQPITKHLAEYLRDYLESIPSDQQWLFPSTTSQTGHTTDIRKPFRRVVIAAGLDPDLIVRHTLRHTAITHLVQAGVDLLTVKRISGHKTLIMVERYAHQSGAHIQAAMDKLDQRYSKIA